MHNVVFEIKLIPKLENSIRNSDMAKEMMELIKNSILRQSSTAVQAQANHVPQTVLKLLQ